MRVRLTETTNHYAGAQPYYVVRYGERGGLIRYTLHEGRARALRGWFLRDVTDPAQLALPPPVDPHCPLLRHLVH